MVSRLPELACQRRNHHIDASQTAKFSEIKKQNPHCDCRSELQAACHYKALLLTESARLTSHEAALCKILRTYISAGIRFRTKADLFS